MKPIIALVTILGLAPIALADTATLHVSKVGADKTELLDAFTAIQKNEKRNRPPQKYKIIQTIQGGYLVHGYKYHASRGPIGISPLREWSEVDLDSTIFLKPLPADPLADGDIIREVWVKYSKEKKTYTDTRGAKRTITILEQIEEPPSMTQTTFITQLKDGKTWTLPAFRKRKCMECFGDGKLSTTHNRAKCPACKGKGTFSTDLLVKW